MKTFALLVLIWGISINHLPVEPPGNSPVYSLSAQTYTEPTDPTSYTADKEATCASTELLRKQMIDLINLARAQPRTCGPMQFEGAPPVRWNYTLEKAAKLHSHKMATQNFFAHRGPDSTHVGIRVQLMGYNWRFVGENIYAGIESVTEAVYGWLESDGHCKTIMNPDYTELGAACERNRASQYESYWTQVFASPM